MNRFLEIDYTSESADNAKTVIIPVPVEYSTSYGKGTAQGPAAIIEASPFLEFYDEELDYEVWKTGIYTAPAIEGKEKPENTMQEIKKVVSSYLNKEKFPIILGGEHSISFAVHEAVVNKYPEISVLQFDAHSDLRSTYQESKFSHACVMRRIWEKNKNITGVGIRSQCIEEKLFVTENNIRIYYAHDLYGREFPETIINNQNENIYITFDLDFFDPSIMPGVGTPEPGGFLWYETVNFLRKVFERKNVVAMDFVEFCPIKNMIHPEFLVAKLIYKLLGFKYYFQGSKK